jgi:putative transposase
MRPAVAFAALKRELVCRTYFAMRKEARSVHFRWIKVWYNRKRRHSTVGYLSPEAFERQYRQQQQHEPIAA